MRHLLALLLLSASAQAYTGSSPTFTSNGTVSDTQAAIEAASDGDTVTIPSGSFTWTEAVTISGKGIHLQGAGAGRVVGRSATSATIPSSFPTEITFTRITENVTTIEALKSALTAGATLKIYRTAGAQNGTFLGAGTIPWMRGTVTSWNDTTDELVMSITSSSYATVAGTHPLWIITTEAATTIVHNGGSSTNSLSITEDVSHHVEVSGIRFTHDPTNVGTVINQVYLNGNDGKPILIHDCYFERLGEGDSIRANARRGIIWNCSFVSLPMSYSYAAFQNTYEGFTTSWSTASTMGTADTTGASNLYIEDCDFHAYISCTDFDANARAVFRYNLVNHASLASHGNDTGPYGVRHVEIYNCDLAFNDSGANQSIPLDRSINLRGGTWIITDNIITNVSSQDWGNKTEITVEIQNLGRSSGTNAGWGYDIPGVQYPAPRQVGFGYVTGAAGNDTSGTYKGDIEPIYIWNNTGTYTLGLSDYPYDAGVTSMPATDEADFLSKRDSISDYVQSGRDYYLNAGASPTWTKPTTGAAMYPHPLRTSTPATPATTRHARPGAGAIILRRR